MMKYEIYIYFFHLLSHISNYGTIDYGNEQWKTGSNWSSKRRQIQVITPKKKKKSLLQKRLFQKAENASQLLLQLIRKKHKSSFWMEQRESRTPLLVASVNILSCSFSMPQGSPWDEWRHITSRLNVRTCAFNNLWSIGFWKVESLM